MNPIIKAHMLAENMLPTDTFQHSLRVAFAVAQSGDPHHIIAALLHDVVEDTSYTADAVLVNFGGDVLHIVDALTRRQQEQYRDYIHRVKARGGGPILVKLADISDNLTGRENPPPPSMRERYAIAATFLRLPDGAPWSMAATMVRQGVVLP